MFRFAVKRQVWWPVEPPVRHIVEPGSEPQKPSVYLLLRLLDREAMNKLKADSVSDLSTQLRDVLTHGGGVEQIYAVTEAWRQRQQSDVERIVAHVVDWKGVQIERDDGVDERFSEENLRLLLSDEGVFHAFAAALLDASRGAKAKN